MKFIFLFLFCLLFFSQGIAQKVEPISVDELMEKIDDATKEKKLTLFNFWATWCAPCVKELPYFEELAKNNPAVNIFLVSVDFVKDIKRVEKFVAQKSLQIPLFILNEKNPSDYIERIDSRWEGSIPATLFITPSGKKRFHETDFSQQTLNLIVNKYIQF